TSRRILMAAFVSLSSSHPHPHSQECQRSSRVFFRTMPHCEQTWEVYLGETFSTVRPAHAALCETICWNWPQPASRMLLLSPLFAAAPLGRYVPFSSCLGLARLLTLVISSSSKTMV